MRSTAGQVTPLRGGVTCLTNFYLMLKNSMFRSGSINEYRLRIMRTALMVVVLLILIVLLKLLRVDLNDDK